MSDPFHEGELKVQELAGERSHAIMNGRLIADTIPAGAAGFVSQQSYCVLGWADGESDLWARVLAGEPGFASSNDSGSTLRLQIDDPAGALAKTPPFNALKAGDQIGALFAELSTRRRLRVNGVASALTEDELVLSVEEAYPNCPKYIQQRDSALSPEPPANPEYQTGEKLDDALRAWISDADTFFVASAYPGGRVDTSHRGGQPGFIKLIGDTLRIPDYPGNSMFGTLGNFAVNPHAGLAFLDFTENRQLQLTGDVTLDLKVAENAEATGNTGRWWEFHPRKWIASPLNKSLDWGEASYSPFNP